KKLKTNKAASSLHAKKKKKKISSLLLLTLVLLYVVVKVMSFYVVANTRRIWRWALRAPLQTDRHFNRRTTISIAIIFIVFLSFFACGMGIVSEGVAQLWF
ncbi:uncharacterized protein PgNI_01394, partial [Pyricularia grisea]|uniref:Uncharacterized protein n=1 Tax=Pyricularia grisea TaxID=148305 RepID=A0A6P8BHM4_PYRGI